MKPVIIFRHALTEGAGYLGSFLTEKQIPWRMVRIDQGDPLPVSMRDFSGMVMMGGPMSVNDDLPWIPPLLSLINEAYAEDIPLLGHCLGGQLISKARGAVVAKTAVKEIGWGEISVSQNGEAKDWFGTTQRFLGFHWHGETFALPAGATHLLSSPYCQNQAYALGKHLAFQCHIEMTVEMVKVWCDAGADEVRGAAASPGVQPIPEILGDLQPRVEQLNVIAESVYERWIKGLAR